MAVKRASGSYILGDAHRHPGEFGIAVPMPDMWLDAADVLGLSDGDSISTWFDRSGSGHDCACTGAIWKSSVTPAGGPSIAPNTGSSTWLGAVPVFASGAAGEMFVVFKYSGVGDSVMLDDWGTSTDVNHWAYANHYYSDFGSTTRKGPIGDAVIGTWYVGNVYSADSDWALLVDGGLIHTTGTNTVAWDTSGYHYISGNVGGSSGNSVAEVLMYQRKLSTTERSIVLSYLGEKHGISV